MNDRIIEFSVDGFVVRGKEVWVGGRCYEDVIRIGDFFTRAFRYAPIYDFWDGPLIRLEEREVLLEVIGIETYGFTMEELERGMSGQLLLQGPGRETLEAGEVIGVPRV